MRACGPVASRRPRAPMHPPARTSHRHAHVNYVCNALVASACGAMRCRRGRKTRRSTCEQPLDATARRTTRARYATAHPIPGLLSALHVVPWGGGSHLVRRRRELACAHAGRIPPHPRRPQRTPHGPAHAAHHLSHTNAPTCRSRAPAMRARVREERAAGRDGVVSRQRNHARLQHLARSHTQPSAAHGHARGSVRSPLVPMNAPIPSTIARAGENGARERTANAAL